MAVSWLAVYRAVLLCAVPVGLFVLYQATSHRETRGARPLALLFCGGLLYVVVKLAVSAVRGTPAVFTLTRLNPLAAGLATAGFLLLAIEYTGVEHPVSRRTVGLLLAEPVVVTALVWTDIAFLWAPTGRDPSTLSGYAWEVTGVAVANQLYMNALLAFGVVLLGLFALRSATVFRMQAVALILAAVGPVVGNLAFYAGAVPFNPTPVAFVLSALLIAWAILRTGFLDLVPVGRSAVVSNLEAGVVTVDSDHRVVDTNAPSHRMLGFDDAGSLVGRHVDVVFAERPAFRERYWSATDGGEQGSVVEVDGRYFTLEVTPLERHPRGPLGHTVVIRDVTDRTLREQELEQKNEQLEQFAGMVSHDLRNPLEVILTRTELIGNGGDPQDHLPPIERSATRMQNMIRDLLILARADQHIDDPEPVSLCGTVEDGWGNVQLGETELDNRVPGDVTVNADRDRLMNVFENLFRNAREHNEPAPTVRVGVLERATAHGDGGSLTGFFIEDDGDGIPAAERDEVFDHGYSTNRDGTGFGLAIVREVVRAHDWSLSVCDGDDGGARFEVTGVECSTRPNDSRPRQPNGGR